MKFRFFFSFFFVFLNGSLLLAFDKEEVKAREIFNQGFSYYQEYAYEAAIDKFFQSLRIKNQKHLVRYYLGLAFYKAGYTEEAIEQWENIIKLGGQDSLLIQKINQLFYLRGRGKKRKSFQDYVFIRSIPLSSTDSDAPQLPIGYPTGLHVDKKDNVYFLDHAKNKIGKINGNGQFEGDFFGGIKAVLPLVNRLNRPYDFIPYGTDRFLVSDFGNDRLVIIGKGVGIEKEIGEKGLKLDHEDGVPQFLGPEGLALDERGNVYVVDTGNCRVQYLNRDGKLLFAFGEKGTSPGELFLPSGIAIDRAEDQILVCDRGNNRVNVYSRTGDFKRSFGESFLHKPRKISIHPDNPQLLVIADAKDVYLYHSELKVYKSVFFNVNQSDAQEIQPLSTAFDQTRLLYVGDAKSGKIHLYSPIKLRYVNLIVQIENINLRLFPRVMVDVTVRNKEGLPVQGLTSDNFEIKENGLKRDFAINRWPEEYNSLRTTFLVERSREADIRKNVLKSMMEDYLVSMDQDDEVQVYGYGGGSKTGEGTYESILPFNGSLLRNVSKTLESKTHERFWVGPALKKAINDHLKLRYKQSVVMLVFEDYTFEDFEPEAFDQIVDFARHNSIPISVVYAGEDGKDLSLLEELCAKTRGKFVIYKNKASMLEVVNHAKESQWGKYTINYETIPNTLKSSLFRPIEVLVNYKSMQGLDNRGGYPIP